MKTGRLLQAPRSLVKRGLCPGCIKPVVAGPSYTDGLDRRWHEDCARAFLPAPDNDPAR